MYATRFRKLVGSRSILHTGKTLEVVAAGFSIKEAMASHLASRNSLWRDKKYLYPNLPERGYDHASKGFTALYTSTS